MFRSPKLSRRAPMGLVVVVPLLISHWSGAVSVVDQVSLNDARTMLAGCVEITGTPDGPCIVARHVDDGLSVTLMNGTSVERAVDPEGTLELFALPGHDYPSVRLRATLPQAGEIAMEVVTDHFDDGIIQTFTFTRFHALLFMGDHVETSELATPLARPNTVGRGAATGSIGGVALVSGDRNIVLFSTTTSDLVWAYAAV